MREILKKNAPFLGLSRKSAQKTSTPSPLGLQCRGENKKKNICVLTFGAF